MGAIIPDFREELPPDSKLKELLRKLIAEAIIEAEEQALKEVEEITTKYLKKNKLNLTQFPVEIIKKRFEFTDFIRSKWISIYLYTDNVESFIEKALMFIKEAHPDGKISLSFELLNIKMNLINLLILERYYIKLNHYYKSTTNKWTSSLLPGGITLELEYFEELTSNLTKLDLILHNQIKSEKKQLKTITKLEKKLEKKKTQLAHAELDKTKAEDNLYKYLSTQVYNESITFDNYIFGDYLPEFKIIYNWLKSTNTFRGSWGYFCHNLQKESNSVLELYCSRKNLENRDVGYLLHKISILSTRTNTEFQNWLSDRVAVESSHQKIISTDDLLKKYIREYKNGTDAPKQKEKIDELFSFLI